MENFEFYTLSLTLLALIFYIWYFVRRPTSGGGATSPPSPPRLPILGNLHQFGQLPHRSLWNLSRKYGPLMLLHLGPKPALVVSSAEVAKEILKTHDVTFADRAATYVMRKIFYDMNDAFFLPYGKRWRQLRGIVVHELLAASRVNSFRAARDEEIALMIKKIEDCSFSDTPVNMTNVFAALSNDLISRAAFGKKHGESEHGKKFLENMEEAVEYLGYLSVGEFIPWLGWIDKLNGINAALDRIVKKRDEILDALIQDHLKTSNASKENMMDILLGIYKGDIPGLSIDLISVKGVILDVFGAGTDTTTTTLIWLMTELLRHPTVMKKLQDEIRQIMKGKENISDVALKKMHYLKAVIKETFRLHPPVAIYLHASRDHVNVMGYEIAPETLVIVNVWAIGQDPACWDEPEKFMPERFLNSSIDYKGFDFHLIPFGAGRRICPGIEFATVVIEHTVANLMLKFDWALPNQAKGEDLDVTERPGLTIGKKIPLVVVATASSIA